MCNSSNNIRQKQKQRSDSYSLDDYEIDSSRERLIQKVFSTSSGVRLVPEGAIPHLLLMQESGLHMMRTVNSQTQDPHPVRWIAVYDPASERARFWCWHKDQERSNNSWDLLRRIKLCWSHWEPIIPLRLVHAKAFSIWAGWVTKISQTLPNICVISLERSYFMNRKFNQRMWKGPIEELSGSLPSIWSAAPRPWYSSHEMVLLS